MTLYKGQRKYLEPYSKNKRFATVTSDLGKMKTMFRTIKKNGM